MRRLFCYPLALLFTLLLSAPLLAQRDRDTYSPPGPNSFEVVGQVKLASTGLPGSRIPVRLERFGGGLVDQMDTDGTGRFRFGNIQRGYYRVIVNAIGYRPAQQDADLQV
ncbi:MAG TPA: carboxypeptidase-like regulatory domain-containing protein, partial [Pyrinomonadaceae bacterium]